MRYSNLVNISGEDIFQRNGHKKVIAAGQMIAEKGDAASSVGFIAKGQARAFCLNASGDEITLFYIASGNMICSESLVSNPSIVVSVDAFSDVELYTMDADAFLGAWFEKGYSVKELLSHFVRRVCLLSDYLCCSHFTKNEERLAYFLHSAYLDAPGEIAYTHEQISAVTGMSTVSVDRILKKLEAEQIIACKYRRIEVLDLQRLESDFHSLGYLLD